MLFDAPLLEANFIARPNRYVVVAHHNGEELIAHCADPGRLTELLQPGATLYLSPAKPSLLPRKTAWDLRLVRDPQIGTLVSLDTRVPNRIFEEGLRSGFFPQFEGWQSIARERPLPLPATIPTITPETLDQRLPATDHQPPTTDHQDPATTAQLSASGPPLADSRLGLTTRSRLPHSRIDFLLTFPNQPRLWVEVKSASLVVDREARFPDAVTERGRRHLLELANLVQQGERAAVVFIVQRNDVDHIVAHRATDPAFADALDHARTVGVDFYAATCSVSLGGITLDRIIPVR